MSEIAYALAIALLLMCIGFISGCVRYDAPIVAAPEQIELYGATAAPAPTEASSFSSAPAPTEASGFTASLTPTPTPSPAPAPTTALTLASGFSASPAPTPTPSPSHAPAPTPAPALPASAELPSDIEPDRELVCRFNDMSDFYSSLENSRKYDADGHVKAGVVPHHLTAAPLISGFFEMCANASPDGYDTVIIVAPNHVRGIADVVYSRRDWNILDGVKCDTDIIDSLADIWINGISIAENDDRVENDHSASVLIPYIAHYFPGAKTVPILVSRDMPLDETIIFAESIAALIHESAKRILLICSIDFSHFVSPSESIINDLLTVDAIESLNYMKIINLPASSIDSPAALIVFLRYLTELGIAPVIVDRADASEYIGAHIEITTSYIVISGSKESICNQ